MKYSRVKERLVKQRKLNVDILKCQRWDYHGTFVQARLDLILTRSLSFLNGPFCHGDDVFPKGLSGELRPNAKPRSLSRYI